MIKAVIFDVDNTLLDFNASATESVKSAFKALRLDYSDDVMTTFLRVNDLLWQKIEKKEMTREELHRVRWNIVFGELKINADGATMEKLFLSRLEDFAIPIDGALDAVKYLSGKYTLYTASNAPYAQQIKRLTLSGILPYIKGIMNFESQGIHKPQKQFFEQCLATIAPVKREETVLIGDSLSADMQGGKSVGFTTVWFNPRKEKTLADICDYTVNALGEIKKLL